MNTSKKILCAVALLTPLLIVGCAGGGGGNGNVADATAVPDSAGASVSAFLAFITSLSANDETSEPLTIGDNFAVPADEENDSQPLT